jgi:two-component system, OmpR family, sensor kinase
MHTPSLRRRVTLGGVTTVAVLLLLFDAFVFLTMRDRLEDTLAGVLDERVRLAVDLEQAYGIDELPDQLRQLGIPAVVTGADGTVTEVPSPPVPVFGPGPPGPVYPAHSRVSEVARLDGGGTVEIFATRAGVDAALRRITMTLAVGTVLALAASVLLFRRVATYAVAPLHQVVAAAGRTAAGKAGERLGPDDPDTELGRMAAAYDRMLDSLEEAVDDAQSAEERTRRFVDDAAHQLRTPLATIRGSVEALLQESDPAIRDRLMSNLVRETARSNRLLTSLLTMARLDRGRPREREPADLVALCHEEIDRVRSLTPDLDVACDHGPGVAGSWILDVHGTQEILANLLDNARRHARNSITIEAELVVGDASPTLEVRVRDDGPGVEPAATNLIFERFATLDGQGGSGLGLPIARSLARAQGGELSHEQGAFVLRLPAEEAVDAPARPGAGSRPGTATSGPRPDR